MRSPRFPNRESVFAEPKARHFFRPGRGIIGRPDETFCEEYARRLAEMSLARILVLRSLSFSPSNPLLHGRNVLFCTLHRSCASWIPRKRDRDDLRRPLRENDARSATLPPATLTMQRASPVADARDDESRAWNSRIGDPRTRIRSSGRDCPLAGNPPSRFNIARHANDLGASWGRLSRPSVTRRMPVRPVEKKHRAEKEPRAESACNFRFRSS